MKRVIIECGAAQTCAALLVDDIVWKFWFGPARGDEPADQFPHAGRLFAGRIKRVDRSLNAAFVDVGDARDGFLPLKKGNQADCIEGALIKVEIKSPPRQAKGAALRFVASLEIGEPGRLPPFRDVVIEAAEAIGADADEILVDDGAALRVLQPAGFERVRHESRPVALFEHYGAAHELDAAHERIVPLAGGGQLIIDEAQALTAIDVDTGGLSALSPARLREKIAFAAASEATRQISMRDIGGHVVIDFPDIPGDAGRKRFQEYLRKVMARLDGVSATSFSRSGLYSFTAPHHALSLLDRITEVKPVAPVAGRFVTVEAAAKSSLANLERNLRSSPKSRFLLTVGDEVEACFSQHPQWRQRLTHRYGARFEIVADDKFGDRSFDLSEQ